MPLGRLLGLTKQTSVVDPDDTDPSLLKRNVDLRRNKDVETDYEIHELLGSGKFGEVKRCTEKSSKKFFAAKFIPIRNGDDQDSVLNEMKVMRKLRHPRLLQIYDAYSTRFQMVLILELITGGELFERVIDDSFNLTEAKCEKFIREICEGVEYIHSQKIVHLDLKPENILCLTRTGFRIKIIDFGLARFWDPKKETRVMFGTPEFVAPEVVNYEPIGPPTDLWSIGVICYVLLSGLSPFMGDSDRETFVNISKVIYSFEYDEFKDISEDAKDFMRKLLIHSPKKRMTAGACLKHPWLKVKGIQDRDGVINTRRLKQYVYRRKWQKAVNAIIALIRMGAVFSIQPNEKVNDLPTNIKSSHSQTSLSLPENQSSEEKNCSPNFSKTDEQLNISDKICSFSNNCLNKQTNSASVNSTSNGITEIT